MADLRRAAGLLALAAGAALAVAGCASPITSGTVLGKQDTPAHYETVFIPVTTGKTTILIPELTWFPEDWQIDVRGDGSQRTGWVEVGQDTYERAVIGRQWKAGQ